MKALFVRLDNIGDLVCTTPAISALRRRYPDALIAALVNSYNADVLCGNADVDRVYVWEKHKHSPGRSVLGALSIFRRNMGTLRAIRGEGFDVAIGCGYGQASRLQRLLYFTGAKVRVASMTAPGPGKVAAANVWVNRPVTAPEADTHEVEAMMRLVGAAGVPVSPIPGLVVRSDAEQSASVRSLLAKSGVSDGEKIAAMHISSRKPRNRWPMESFKILGDMIAESGFRVMLLWSPGSEKSVTHPGDDERSALLAASMAQPPVAVPTTSVKALIAALDVARVVVCCDGGAMHLAAGLGKPVLAVWGSTSPARWAPWGVPHAILQKASGSAADVGPEEAFAAFKKLHGGLA